MTFVERMAQIVRTNPLPMPDDYMPALTETNEMVTARDSFEGQALELSLQKPATERGMKKLRFGMWQAREIVRLRDAKELGLV